MITIYKIKDIPKNKEVIKLNDIYFNKYTSELINEHAATIICFLQELFGSSSSISK